MCFGSTDGLSYTQKAVSLLMISLHHLVYLWSYGSTKISVENFLRDVHDVVRNSFAEEGSKIICEVVAVVRPEIISLSSS